VSADPRIARGMGALLERRAALLAEGAQPLGWKVGFNVPSTQERLGIDGPLAGFLTSAGLLADGAVYSLGGEPAIAEPEVAVEVGAAGRSIAALLPALEVAHPPDLSQDVEDILAGNIFHRAVAFGPRVEATAPGAARVLVNGEERHSVAAEETGARLPAMVEAIAGRLAEAGEELRPGDRIITGVIAPPPAVEPGDRVRLELEALGAVELGFSE
jgi:2-keto-4-pentenoate hydratase